MYKAGSVFSGIGGIDLAFSRAGFDVRWQVEIDPFCRAVLAKHAAEYWPNARIYNDVKEVGKAELEPVDVIFGGFPCQDISTAGKGAGIKKGTRSGLWFEFARIIGELRPRFVLMENVPVITKRGLGVVLGQLSEMGYDAEWGIVPASAVGAPHERKRWWCVAYSQCRGCRSDGIDRVGEAMGERRNATYHTSETPHRDTGLVDSNSVRRGQSDTGQGQRLSDSQRNNPPQESGREFIESGTVPTSAVGFSHSTGLEGQRTRAISTSSQVSMPSSNDTNVGNSESRGEPNESSSKGIVQFVQFGRSNWWVSQSIVGRAVNGLSRQLDSRRWPALPGQQQHGWEAPRTVPKYSGRSKRVRALGNAVVPQVVQPFAEAIYAILEEANTQDGAA